MNHPFSRRNIALQVERLLKALREAFQDIADQHRRDSAIAKPPAAWASMKQAVETAIQELDRIKPRVVLAMTSLADARTAKTQEYRAFKLDHGVGRDARRPDILTTLLIAVLAILIEGAITASLMIADGKMDIVSGAAYGLSFAAIGFGAGLFNGYFPGRYLDYRVDSPSPRSRDRLTRIAAWTGFGGLLGVMGLLSFAAARVRATGSHTDIFDFSAVSFGATFADYFALAIMAVGGLGGLLAVYKGRTGISDPIPGFAEAEHEAKAAIVDAAQDSADAYFDAAETVYETVRDRLDDLVSEQDDDDRDRAEANADLNAAIVAHNHAVDSAIETFLRLWEEDRSSVEYITQKPQRGRKPDTEIFDALRYPPVPLHAATERVAPHIDAVELIQRLDAAYERTCTAIREAHLAFLADVPAFDFNDNSGD